MLNNAGEGLGAARSSTGVDDHIAQAVRSRETCAFHPCAGIERSVGRWTTQSSSSDRSQPVGAGRRVTANSRGCSRTVEGES